MSDDNPKLNEARYQTIRRNIAHRRPFGATQQAAPAQKLLDQLNAYDALRNAKYDIPRRRCYGPKVCQGSDWAGVVLWWPDQGYYGYQKLTLVGVWGLVGNAEWQILVGARQLAYQAAIYDPEAYHQLIKKQFSLYYEDHGAPPSPSNAIWQSRYHPDQRLHLRAELRQALHRLLTWDYNKPPSSSS